MLIAGWLIDPYKLKPDTRSEFSGNFVLPVVTVTECSVFVKCHVAWDASTTYEPGMIGLNVNVPLSSVWVVEMTDCLSLKSLIVTPLAPTDEGLLNTLTFPVMPKPRNTKFTSVLWVHSPSKLKGISLGWNDKPGGAETFIVYSPLSYIGRMKNPVSEISVFSFRFPCLLNLK